MSDNKGTATTTPIFPDVNRNSLEPMFVQTMPRLGVPSTSHANSNQLLDYQHIVAQMPLVNHGQTATWMQDAELRRYEWQMEQLRNASAVSAIAASAASDVRSEAPQSVDLHSDLEKLTQNVATLSLQLSFFEMQMQDRMHPMSTDLMASAALAQAMHPLPAPPAPPGVGLRVGLSTDGPLLCPALFGVATNRVPEDGNPKKV